MEQFKRARVVILPTNQQTKYLMVYSDVQKTKGKLILNGLKNDEYKEYQHLYIISDDEIKEGDWFYNIHSKIVGRAAFNFGKDELAKKIIATTDTSLLIDTYINQGDTVKGDLIIKRGSDYTTGLKGRINLPQPSQQFIEKYIEEYNKGNIIEDVLVEYGKEYVDEKDAYGYDKLKINPKNNTITIKKAKDSWTREEVIELCRQVFIDGTYAGGFVPNEKTIDSETEKWIEEKL